MDWSLKRHNAQALREMQVSCRPAMPVTNNVKEKQLCSSMHLIPVDVLGQIVEAIALVFAKPRVKLENAHTYITHNSICMLWESILW